MIAKLSKKKIREDILREARVLNMHQGIATLIADKVTDKVIAWSKKRSMVTVDDLNSRLAKEIKIYDEDLAFLFESRDKIL